MLWQYLEMRTTERFRRAARSVIQYGTRSFALTSSTASDAGMIRRFSASAPR